MPGGNPCDMKFYIEQHEVKCKTVVADTTLRQTNKFLPTTAAKDTLHNTELQASIV